MSDNTREQNLQIGTKNLAGAYYLTKDGKEAEAIERCFMAIKAIRAAGRQRVEEERGKA